VRVVLDDDEVSSDEDEPLQQRLQRLSGVGPSSAALNGAATMTTTADKEAVDRRAAEEAAVKRAAEEAVVKAATEEEVTGMTTNEAAGAAGDSSALG
jgi:hypothetical protein